MEKGELKMSSITTLINVIQYPNNIPYEKLDFSRFIKQKQKEREITTRELANLVGISYGVFSKIINREKPTKKRDLIIIICYLLHLEQYEYDDALDRYSMPIINEHDERDSYLYNTLLNDPNLSLDDINSLLIHQGLSPLDLHNKRNTNNSKATNIEKEFEEFHESEIQIKYDYIFSDQYNSLSTIYSPQNYQVGGTSYLRRIKTNKKIIIHIDEENNLYLQKKNNHYHLVKDIDKSNILYSNYTSLLSKIEKERKTLLDILNDTKNYGCRSSANYTNNHIVIFSEDFNYSIPELNEYYTVEYYDNIYHYKIYKTSAFMSLYLSDKEYTKTFNRKIPKAFEEYTSIDDIAKVKDKKTKYGMQFVPYKSRERIFRLLKQNVDNIRSDLINRNIFIQNIDYIYDYPEEVFRFYKIEKDFQCEYDKIYGEITSSSDSATFSLPNGKKVEINKKDVFRGFELGINNINDICMIIDRYGSIDSLL